MSKSSPYTFAGGSGGGGAGVSSFNTRNGAVTLTEADVLGASGQAVLSVNAVGVPFVSGTSYVPGNIITYLGQRLIVSTAFSAGNPIVAPAGSFNTVPLGSYDVVLNVVDYGADPTNAARSTTAFAAVQTASQALATSGVPVRIYMPAGSFGVATAGFLSDTTGLVSYEGNDVGTTTILPYDSGGTGTFLSQSMTAASWWSADNYQLPPIKGFTLDGTHAGASTVGIRIGPGTNGHVDVAFQNFTGTTTGTATAGGASTITDSGATWTTNAFSGRSVTITSGTGSGQTRLIASNTGTVITTQTAWGTNPDNTSHYSITSATALLVKNTVDSGSTARWTENFSFGPNFTLDNNSVGMVFDPADGTNSFVRHTMLHLFLRLVSAGQVGILIRGSSVSPYTTIAQVLAQTWNVGGNLTTAGSYALVLGANSTDASNFDGLVAIQMESNNSSGTAPFLTTGADTSWNSVGRIICNAYSGGANTSVASGEFQNVGTTSAAGLVGNYQTITANGTLTAGASGTYEIGVIAGGGQGGGTSAGASYGGGGGGGSGGVSIGYFALTAGEVITFVIGAGGSTGGAGALGQVGANSTATGTGVSLGAGGGGGGAANSTTTAGQGGSGGFNSTTGVGLIGSGGSGGAPGRGPFAHVPAGGGGGGGTAAATTNGGGAGAAGAAGVISAAAGTTGGSSGVNGVTGAGAAANSGGGGGGAGAGTATGAGAAGGAGGSGFGWMRLLG